MEMRAETSKVLMSDVLYGQVAADVEDEAVNEAADALERTVVNVVADFRFGQGEPTAVCGILRSVLFGKEPELEFRVTLEDAFSVVDGQDIAFLGFELHHVDKVIKVPGPFNVTGARIDEVDAVHGLCVLSLGLQRLPR